jgi:probable addiction module antidote protein
MKTIEFNAADYLDNEEVIAAYISQVLQDGNTEELLRAIGHIARARGMTQLAKDTGIGRESLYKALSADAKPRFDTILKVLQALGIKLHAEA